MEAHCRRSYSAAQQLQEIDDPAIDTIVAAARSGALVGYVLGNDRQTDRVMARAV